MTDFTGQDVNAILKLVKAMVPGEFENSGNIQLTMLATVLCVAARDLDIERENFLAHLANHFDEAQAYRLEPLSKF